MPSFITHYYTGLKIKENLDDKTKALFAKYPYCFNYGCQGPDLWFFYDALPYQDLDSDVEYNRIGNLIHYDKTNDYFHQFYQTIINETDDDLKDAMIVYATSQLFHWATDSICHPYVYYKTYTDVKSYYHIRLESEIDVYITELFKKEKIKLFPLVNLTKKDEITISAMQKLNYEAYKNVFSVELKENDVEKATNDCKTVIFLTSIKSKLLLKLVQAYEKKNNKLWSFSSHILTLPKNEKEDILNLNHQKWCLPDNEKEASIQSFYELLDDAINRGSNAAHLFIEAINKQNDQEFLDYLGNKNYVNGRNYQPSFEFRDLIYKED